MYINLIVLYTYVKTNICIQFNLIFVVHNVIPMYLSLYVHNIIIIHKYTIINEGRYNFLSYVNCLYTIIKLIHKIC